MPTRKAKARSIEELNTTYLGQWVMVQVTATHMGWPTEGEIVAHGQRELIDQLLATLPRAEAGHPYYSFLAAPPIRTVEEWRAVLDAIPDEEQRSMLDAVVDIEDPLAR